MKFSVLASLASFLLSGVAAAPVAFRGDDVVKQVDVPSYAGRWYQAYTNQVVLSTFEKDAVCVTADYSIRSDGNIGVFNAQNNKVPGGEVKTITGVASVPNPAEPGKLVVDLEGAPVEGTYWINALGPIENGQYRYAIVSDQLYPLGTLFVLARDMNEFNARFDAEVKAKLNELGFNKFFNKPIPTVQGASCNYVNPPSMVDIADTVKAVDLNAYAGRWFQTYTNQLVLSTFEKDATCVTADYSIRADGAVGVFNAQNNKVPGGELKTITGVATIPDASEPGKLVVNLEGAPADGSYWIMALGPIENGQYQYSIVADQLNPLGTLFVLARDVQDFNKRFDAEVKAKLNEIGFNKFFNSPIKTLHTSECLYA